MQDLKFWQRKIQALLHDPPNKALNIKGHEAEARAWAQKLGIGKLNDQDFKPADWIASAADRLNFPSYWSIGGANFRNKPYLTHPLTGKKLNLGGGRFLPTQINEDWLRTAMQTSIDQIPDAIKADRQKLFLWLWRNWSSEIQAAEGNQLGALWDLLPADTRIPDHSIWAHQSLTSAIAATADSKGDPDPAFLLFTIGPVQAFISAARRTQDLWAGSYLLSYLNWQAIQVIAEEIGPDAVIFPNLIGQPLCDRWLQSKGVFTGEIKPEDLILPSLPNRFLAIVPASQGKELAQKAAKAVKEAWYEISNAVRTDLENLFPNGLKTQWQETWKRQIESTFDTYWQVYPWRPQGHSIQDKDYKFLDPHKPFLGDRLTKTEGILKIYAKQEKDGGGQYAPNIGAIYSDLYFITEKALGSRKALRNFPQVPEQGDKSTLGGDRAALHDLSSDLTVKEFWNNFTNTLRAKGIYEIQEGGVERLDAIELTKRFAWRSFFKKQDGYDMNSGHSGLTFPSTSSVATATFKNNVISQLILPNPQKLKDALDDWIRSIPGSIREQNTTRKNVIPFLVPHSVGDKSINKSITDFLMIDGRLLFQESYQQEIDLSANEIAIKKTIDRLKDFLKVAQEYKIAKPRKYFAVLMMDGDNMGSWISGEKMPEYRMLLHPDTQQSLETDSTYKEIWEPILNNPRLMSPAIHGFISKALGDFSLKLVRHIVEERYAGKLVYAGGDDVMALLPLDCALEVARELRAAFSGELTTDDQGEKLEVDFAAKESQASKSGYVLLKRPNRERELLTTMGSEATASTGIVIAHHTQPLDLTLQEVRKAEKAAKSAGRNSFSLTFLKRSGEIMTAGAKWYYSQNTPNTDDKQEDKSLDTIALLLKFQKHFADDHISSKFPYILREHSETLADLDIEGLYAAEIKRLLHRQQGEKKLSEAEEKLLAEELATMVIRANSSHRASLKEDDANKAKPQTQLKTFASLLVFTRFLATGEGEE
jgi:CRISPR-associated protein Cmr2